MQTAALALLSHLSEGPGQPAPLWRRPVLDAPLPAALHLGGPLLAMSRAEGGSGSPAARRLTGQLPRLCCPPLEPISRVNTFLQYLLFIAWFTKIGCARC